jgi:hypothetical protein
MTTSTLQDQLLADIDSATATPARALFTRQEAARIIGVTDTTLRRWDAKGYGPQAIKVGARFRYSRASLIEFLAK